MLPMDFAHRYSLREQKERAMHLLDQVGIAEHARKLPSAMSGGQQQRIAIARALACDPPVLLADEPTGSLDSATANEVLSVFKELVHQGKTILMATHDKDIMKWVRRTVLLSDGEIMNGRTR
jgi:putative ABC transport system ATP-binding protein